MVKRKKSKPISLLKRKSASHAQESHSKKTHKRLKSTHNQTPSNQQPTKTHLFVAQNEIHRQSAQAITRLLRADATSAHGTSLKSLTLAPHITNKKAVYAVTIETLKYIPVLEKIVDALNTQQLLALPPSPSLPRSTAFVLIRDLLWGEGLLPKNTSSSSSSSSNRIGTAEKRILSLEDDLNAALASVLYAANTTDVTDLLPAIKFAEAAANRPRTARVNLLKLSVDECLFQLSQDQRFSKIKIHIDPLIPELLVFPPNTSLHDHPLVHTGALVLQSKASCMPARALAPTPGWSVLDACAAPGNKTTHVAALVGSKGKVFAYDKDAKRLERLKENVEKTGAARIITPHCADFLSLNPLDFDVDSSNRVDAIVLDPSCSGSGTAFTRMDHMLPSAATNPTAITAPSSLVHHTDARIQSLAAFQTSALAHALRFPRVQRVSYSTCSVHAAENERVVAAVLYDTEQGKEFELVRALPEWHRRGVEGCGLKKKDAKKVVRTDPIEDGTDGFFVAVLQRRRTVS